MAGSGGKAARDPHWLELRYALTLIAAGSFLSVIPALST